MCSVTGSPICSAVRDGSSGRGAVYPYFIVTAIAGTRPAAGTEGYKGTLGFAGIARWVVDGDLGTHFDYRDVTPHDPPDVHRYAWIPIATYENAQFHLNEQLAHKAYEL